MRLGASSLRILLTADPELPVPPLLYGGIERIVAALVRELVARKHEVALVAHPDSSATDQLFPWPGRRSQHLPDIIRNTAALFTAVQEFRPDVLHSFSRALYLLPLLRSRLPKLMSYQRRPGKRQVAWAARMGRGSLLFTGCSEHICQGGRAISGEWHAIHNFVDPTKFVFNPSVAEDAPLVFLSRIERMKGAHLAIRVARATNRRILLAGNHGTGGEEGRYWSEEIEPQLGPDVVYVGAVDDAQKNELLGRAAAMIVPIEWDEPFGIVFAESLACGTPVISCPRGALPEIIRHGVDGFLINDFAEACEAVAALSGLSRRACRDRVESAFSLPVIASQYEALYRAIADRA